MHTHHTGSQQNKVVTEEPEETPVQELPERHEPEEELQECPITGLAPLRKASPGAFYVSLISANLCYYIMIGYLVALSYRSCLTPSMLGYTLNYYLSTYLVLCRVGSKSMLSLLSTVEVG